MLRYLVDTSALVRLTQSSVRDHLQSRIARGFVGTCIVTDLEVGHSARSTADHARQGALLSDLVPVLITPRAEQRAREIQRDLIAVGTHRAVSVADLLLAAVADVERLTILHYDADFDLIASVTDQPTEWVAPRGSID